jgi:hypothetical protein
VLGGRTLIRLAGEVSPALEKYRALAQYQPAIRQSGFSGALAAEILNRLLETYNRLRYVVI